MLFTHKETLLGSCNRGNKEVFTGTFGYSKIDVALVLMNQVF